MCAVHAWLHVRQPYQFRTLALDIQCGEAAVQVVGATQRSAWDRKCLRQAVRPAHWWQA